MEPDEKMGFRMLDYRVRVYRRFPLKTMHQVVIYLKPTKSALVYQDSFQLGETTHHYRTIRLWEQSSDLFLTNPGLLPLAILTQSKDPTTRLREVAKGLDTIENQRVRANLMAATAVFAGLVMTPEMIKTILRNDIMKESAFYQDILQEGHQKGRQEGRQEGEVALLMRLLVKRFGNVSESIESRLTQATIADLELWGDRILEAKTLTDVFD
jgi:predicted transposase/invertase (TIGR01784 family)